MSKCANCKHWKDDPENYRMARSGAVDPPWTDPPSHRLCLRIGLIGRVWKENPIAYTADASGYQADLWTSAEFGCSLWEATAETAAL